MLSEVAVLRPADRPDMPRNLHPVAWWVWAACLAAAASRTTNPFLLVLVVAVAGYVVAARREVGTPPVFVTFLLVGLFVIGVRVVTGVVLGSAVGGRTVLFHLPSLRLPQAMSGVTFGGAVTLEGLLYALYDGMRLAAVLCCLGAANTLASPRRLLRHVPATLYEVGTALVVALTYAPQLVVDARRVRMARRLRGQPGRGLREIGRVAVPVLEGALDRALELAASMESRGYGRSVHRDGRARTTALTLVGVGGVVVGMYGLLDGASPPLLGLPVLALGAVGSALALWTGARRDRRSRYRPDPWALPEWAVVASGVASVAVLVWCGQQQLPGIVPPTSPASWPDLPWQAVLGVLAPLLAAVLAPMPPLRARLEHERVAAARPGAAS